jgi:hypothetical protein
MGLPPRVELRAKLDDGVHATVLRVGELEVGAGRLTDEINFDACRVGRYPDPRVIDATLVPLTVLRAAFQREHQLFSQIAPAAAESGFRLIDDGCAGEHIALDRVRKGP